MADTARTLAIRQALQLRLQGITVANGYHTDAGLDVRLEPSSLDVGTRITIYSGGTTIGDSGNANERAFTLVVEAVVPTTLANAAALVDSIAEDIEKALDAYLPMPGALPLRFQESLILDRPDGMPAMAAQLMFTTSYRR